jgi:hypothetical protein
VPLFFYQTKDKQMKIKITEPGWAGYTGYLGAVDFKDGVSIDEVSRADAAQLAGIVSVQVVETGENPSDAQRIVDGGNVKAPVEAAKTAPVRVQVLGHTKASLEDIADAQGIKGIREIAEPMGLKGNSISELIEKVLGYQADNAE